jgi:uncharacterized protein (TIGR02145 family)
LRGLKKIEMKNNSLLVVLSLMFVLFALGSSCVPEPPPPPDPPVIQIPTSVTDIDGNTYSVKQFGMTLWMTENLRVTQYDTLSPRKNETIAVAISNQSVDINKPYYIDARGFEDSPYTDNLTENIRKSLGLLYNWSAAAGTAVNNTTVGGGTQGICPNGWVLPTADDWKELLSVLGEEESAGQKLKSQHGWYTDSGSGTNQSNMNCYPAGLAANNFVSLVGRQTMFWSSTNPYDDKTKAEVLQLLYDSDKVGMPNINKFQANSVRCVWHIPIVEDL